MEKKYLQEDKALAVVCGRSGHFYVYICEAHLNVVIDHKALILLFRSPKIKYPGWRDRSADCKPSKDSIFVCNLSRCLDDC